MFKLFQIYIILIKIISLNIMHTVYLAYKRTLTEKFGTTQKMTGTALLMFKLEYHAVRLHIWRLRVYQKVYFPKNVPNFINRMCIPFSSNFIIQWNYYIRRHFLNNLIISTIKKYFSTLLIINITNDVLSATILYFSFIGVNTPHTAHLEFKCKSAIKCER